MIPRERLRETNASKRLAAASSRSESGPASDRWLLSYADFVTLLFALFIVLYASARVDLEERAALLRGVQRAFTIDPFGLSPEPATPLQSNPQETTTPASAPPRLIESLTEERLARMRSDTGARLGVESRSDERGLVLSLASTEFFPAGGIEIPEERKRILAQLAPLLESTNQPVHFEGHTDDQPIAAGPFPSNWELSAARAAAVARYFMEAHDLDPDRVAATGFAEFKPLAANLGPTERAQNRRVEIVLLYDAGESAPTRARDTERDLVRLLERLPPIPESDTP